MTRRPTAPPVPLPVWADLFAAAGEFREERPWELMDDRDMVGVCDPSSGVTGYGCVMGSMGELFGFVLYRGPDGLESYRQLIRSKGNFDPFEFLAVQDCLKFELGARKDLDPSDISVIKSLGLSFKGRDAWPSFRSMIPGYAPWYLTEAEVLLFTLGLRVACHHARLLDSGAVEHPPEDQFIMYTPAGNGGKEFTSVVERWPSPEPRPIHLPIIDLSRIRKLNDKALKPDTSWEAGTFTLPFPIMEGDRPYFTRAAAVCQESSGLVFAADPRPPEISVPQMIADAICASVESTECLPDVVWVDSADVAAALAPLAKALKFEVRRRKNLKTVKELRKSMMSFLSRGR